MLRIALMLAVGIGLSALVAYGIHRNVLGPAQAREEAFDAIQSGQLAAGPEGVVALPAKWAGASIDGKAYVTHSAQHLTWGLFVTERGFGNRFSGDLFCDKPARAVAKGTMEINGPVPAAGDQRGARVEPVEVKVVRVLSPWSFEVAREKP
jgi:hypothetical protein